MSISSAAQPSVVLQNLSAIGTFAAALATTVIVAFTLVQLRLLRRQLEAARAQAAAAAEAGEAAREAVDAIGAIIGLAVTGRFAVPALIMSLYMCLLVTVLMFLLVSQERRYLREVKYAPALLPMRKAFSEVANASWHLFNGNPPEQEAFRLRLRESLRWFAEAFTLASGSQCRACIKVIQAPSDVESEHDLLVQTLCRDNEDKVPRHSPDRIGDNTDFKQIFTENKAYFFSNDLEAMLAQGYRNSHWSDDDILKKNFAYLATMVWPIERGATDCHGDDEEREIIGFLCVDTLAKGAFLKTYDDALGSSFARALYLALHRFREIISTSGPAELTRGEKS